MQCDCDHILPDFREGHYYNCNAVWNEKEMGFPCPKSSDGSMRLRNEHLRQLESDVLYHLGLDTSADLRALFGDIKFVCMGGTKLRMREFAMHMRQVLGLHEPQKLVNLVKLGHRYTMYKVGPVLSVSFVCMGGTKLRMREFAMHMRQVLGLHEPQKLVNLVKLGHRYTMYKVGPVLSVSHGIGIPSLSVVLQELFKLLYYAKASDPVFFRIGTSGGLGVPPGSVVVSAWAMNGSLEKTYDVPVLGKMRKLPSIFDERLCREVRSEAETVERYQTFIGGTMAADDFYRGQARLDGPFCDYTEAEKMSFLKTLSGLGVKNIEMEATAFAAYTREAGVRAADVCVTLLNRLHGDQVSSSQQTMMEYQMRPIELVGRFIAKHCASKSS